MRSCAATVGCWYWFIVSFLCEIQSTTKLSMNECFISAFIFTFCTWLRYALCALKLWPRKWWHLVYHILILIVQACIMYFKCIIMHCLVSLWINEWMNEWKLVNTNARYPSHSNTQIYASCFSCLMPDHTWCTVIEYWMLNIESMNICMIATMTTIQIKWWLSKFNYVWMETKVNHLRYFTIPMHFIIAFNLMKAHCSSISISFSYCHLSFALLWFAFSILAFSIRHIRHSLLDTKLKYMWHCCIDVFKFNVKYNYEGR